MIAPLTFAQPFSQTVQPSLLEALPDAILVSDLEGRVIWASQRAARLFGYDQPDDLLGINSQNLIQLDDPTVCHTIHHHATPNSPALRQEDLPIQLHQRDGSLWPALLTVSSLHDTNGQPVGFMGIMRDVSPLRQAQQQAQQARQEAAQLKAAQAELQTLLIKQEEMLSVMTRFVSMVSHDFRTPLTSILTYADLLESYDERLSHEKRQRYVQQIQDSVKHLKRLLDDVLIIGRAQAGRLELQPVPIDLAYFCRNLIDELRLSTPLDWTIELTLSDDLHPACMDEKLLRQILDNLLSNAIKYSPQGGRISLNVNHDQDWVVFNVTDQGLGIKPEDQRRLFESFYRASNVGQIPGHGLGLAIVKYSVDIQHGSIGVTSQIGLGTTFVVKLPLQPATD